MKPRRIFVDSMSDLFHADVPTEFLDQVFGAMAAAERHTFQVLTKRPQRMERYLNDPATRSRINDAGEALIRIHGSRQEKWDSSRRQSTWTPLAQWPLPNVWLGTSVENQEAAYRIDWLVKTPAAVRFLSCEPLLGPLSLRRPCPHGPHYDGGYCNHCVNDYQAERFGTYHPLDTGAIDWVIVGGESGPGFRQVDPAWVRSLRDERIDWGGAFFFKQWGGRTAKAGGRELDGRTWDEMPAVAV
jgi:protein gp37